MSNDRGLRGDARNPKRADPLGREGRSRRSTVVHPFLFASPRSFLSGLTARHSALLRFPVFATEPKTGPGRSSGAARCHLTKPRKKLATAGPTPSISYETPTRRRKRALSPVRPKFGERRKVNSCPGDQATVGAT